MNVKSIFGTIGDTLTGLLTLIVLFSLIDTK